MAEKISIEAQKRKMLITEIDGYLKSIKDIFNSIEDSVESIELYAGINVSQQLRNNIIKLKYSMNNAIKNLKQYSDDITLASVQFHKVDLKVVDLIKNEQRKLDSYTIKRK